MTRFDTPEHRTCDRSHLAAAGETTTALGPSPRVRGMHESERGVIVDDYQRAHRWFRLRDHVLGVRYGRKAGTEGKPSPAWPPAPSARAGGHGSMHNACQLGR